MANQRAITLRTTHATPANIVLYATPVADVVTVSAAQVLIYLYPRTPPVAAGVVGYSRARAVA